MAKVLVSLPEEFLSVVDNIAVSEQRTRSELVREALRNYIKKARPINVELNENRAKILENLLS